MTKTSDEQLMLAFKNSDEKAFETLYARHKDAVYRYFLRHTSNDSHAGELHQDLWLKVIHSKNNFDKDSKSFKAWLYTLAHHRWVDWYRRSQLEKQVEKQTQAFESEADQEPQASKIWNPEDQLQTKRLGKKLKQAISQLPNDQKDVFLLHQEASMTLPEIAQMMQEGVEKIKSRYRYALKKLRSKMESYHD